MTQPILIAGGGIGGLTAGIALRRAGFEVRVFERAPEIGEVGAGLTIQSNAILALRRIGLDRDVIASGQVLAAASVRTPNGRVISQANLADVGHAVGAPPVAIHRATLQRLLLDALGADAVETGRDVQRYEARADGVSVIFQDGEPADGALLIGADGIRSAVRAQMLGDGEPLYAGYTCWRGVTREGGPPLPVIRETTETWGRGRRFGIVPIERGRIYWFATLNAPPGGRDEPGRVRAAVEHLFAAWHPPVLDVLAATPEEAILHNDILHRLPAPRWVDGRVALLGDAAHPMTPNLGQGACQAIEDAVILADCLARDAADPDQALQTYQRRRKARADSFVLAALRLGRLAQIESAAGRWMRDRLLALTPDWVARGQLVRSLRFGG
ncbi:MAG TPA: FAD-dependent monooxygenase [Thermoanaerobaculia bacterium]|nr:FAD-dependent monooxygenase [Thermoanaerobaculia bacterium]